MSKMHPLAFLRQQQTCNTSKAGACWFCRKIVALQNQSFPNNLQRLLHILTSPTKSASSSLLVALWNARSASVRRVKRPSRPSCVLQPDAARLWSAWRLPYQRSPPVAAAIGNTHSAAAVISNSIQRNAHQNRWEPFTAWCSCKTVQERLELQYESLAFHSHLFKSLLQTHCTRRCPCRIDT